MLPAEKLGGLARQPAEDHIGGVDDVPGALHVDGPGLVGTHRSAFSWKRSKNDLSG
jgi:hypothetical protein